MRSQNMEPCPSLCAWPQRQLAPLAPSVCLNPHFPVALLRSHILSYGYLHEGDIQYPNNLPLCCVEMKTDQRGLEIMAYAYAYAHLCLLDCALLDGMNCEIDRSPV